jgi:hypothetical protein
VSALFYLSAESPGAKIISNRPQLTPLIHPFSPSDTTLCAPDAAAAAAAAEFWSDIREHQFRSKNNKNSWCLSLAFISNI